MKQWQKLVVNIKMKAIKKQIDDEIYDMVDSQVSARTQNLIDTYIYERIWEKVDDVIENEIKYPIWKQIKIRSNRRKSILINQKEKLNEISIHWYRFSVHTQKLSTKLLN